jgi:tetraacyldisaccharide 4'-kinase
LNPLSAAYGLAARLRRTWYAGHPQARRRLGRPVISVGNLVVGGSGKTPVVAALAERLRNAGERPAILSRGYARRQRTPDVLIVSDGARVLASVEQSGDEPQMLARMLEGVPVLVSPDRYAAGRIAESQCLATVLLLDDGFQHLELSRDVDLLIVSPADLEEQVLPAGALREPLDAARYADAVIASGDEETAARLAGALGVREAFTMTTRYEPPRLVVPFGQPLEPAAPRRVVAVCGIARPHRFLATLAGLGWDVADMLAFPDHHWFTERDLARVADAARRAGVDLVMTTEKDAVRMGEVPAGPGGATWAYLPMRVRLGPAERLDEWVMARIEAARA